MTAKHLNRAELADRTEPLPANLGMLDRHRLGVYFHRPAIATYCKAREETGRNSTFKLAGAASMAGQAWG